MSKPGVALDVQHRLGTLELQARLTLSAPWTVLFGPSGSGKSTLLRVIAGLVRPDHGFVALSGLRVADSGAGLWVPASQREMRWAGQRAALFPHMTVRENVEYGLEGATMGRLESALEAFHLSELAGRRPAELSGGQQQRVAVARAAVGAEGKLLLLDEPFSGLDAGVRGELIGSLRAWLPGTPVISVTHDVGEAFLLRAEVVRLEAGRVVAQGPVELVLEKERGRLLGILG